MGKVFANYFLHGEEINETRNNNGNYHSYDDLPCREMVTLKQYHIKIWAKNGVVHRDNGPAITDISPTYARDLFYDNGLCHNENGPAIVFLHKNEITHKFYLWGRLFTYATYIKKLGKLRSDEHVLDIILKYGLP